MGPEMMQEFRDQAERFGTRFITDNVTKFEPGADGEPHKVWIDDELVPGARGDPRDGRGAQEARRARRGGARRPRRVLLRDLRRRLLQGPHDDHRRRRRLRDGGGDLPRQVLLARSRSCNRRDEFRASKIMLERARATENIEFLTPYTVDAFLAGESGLLDRAQLRNAETGETRELPMAGAFIAIGHEPQSEIVDGHRRDRRRGLRQDRGQVHPHEPPRRLRRRRPRATTPTARPSPPPARAVRPRWTPSGTCATTRPCPTPAALEGTGDLAEQQWAPAARS